MTYFEWILIGGIVALFVYEIIALVRREPKTPTISSIVWTITTRTPLLAFAMGMLMGHFFWQRGGCVQTLSLLVGL